MSELHYRSFDELIAGNPAKPTSYKLWLHNTVQLDSQMLMWSNSVSQISDLHDKLQYFLPDYIKCEIERIYDEVSDV